MVVACCSFCVWDDFLSMHWPTLCHFLQLLGSPLLVTSGILHSLTLSLHLVALYSNIPLSPLNLLAFLFYLFLLITHSAVRIFSVAVTCRHKCFTFLKEVCKMPLASLAFATASSFPFPFFISKCFGCIVRCACPPPLWLPLCSAKIVITVYCDRFLAEVQIQFFILLSLSAVSVSCAAF